MSLQGTAKIFNLAETTDDTNTIEVFLLNYNSEAIGHLLKNKNLTSSQIHQIRGADIYDYVQDNPEDVQRILELCSLKQLLFVCSIVDVPAELIEARADDFCNNPNVTAEQIAHMLNGIDSKKFSIATYKKLLFLYLKIAKDSDRSLYLHDEHFAELMENGLADEIYETLDAKSIINFLNGWHSKYLTDDQYIYLLSKNDEALTNYIKRVNIRHNTLSAEEICKKLAKANTVNDTEGLSKDEIDNLLNTLISYTPLSKELLEKIIVDYYYFDNLKHSYYSIHMIFNGISLDTIMYLLQNIDMNEALLSDMLIFTKFSTDELVSMIPIINDEDMLKCILTYRHNDKVDKLTLLNAVLAKKSQNADTIKNMMFDIISNRRSDNIDFILYCLENYGSESYEYVFIDNYRYNIADNATEEKANKLLSLIPQSKYSDRYLPYIIDKFLEYDKDYDMSKSLDIIKDILKAQTKFNKNLEYIVSIIRKYNIGAEFSNNYMYKLVTTAKDSYYENYDKVLDLCSGEQLEYIYDYISGKNSRNIKKYILASETWQTYSKERAPIDCTPEISDLLLKAIHDGQIRQSDKDELDIKDDDDTVKRMWKSLSECDSIIYGYQKYLNLAKRSLE